MTDDQIKRLVNAIGGHGDQLGGNLVFLKAFLQKERQEQEAFLAKQQEAQQAFLAEQRAASDKAQALANRSAMWAAVATGLAALGALGQLIVAAAKL